jgi:ectoine hydroxylase-related dioxygenase (phytanoyl-CoA dioxygenase family)
MKEAGSGLRTAFHQDAPYFPFSGLQCAICWVPATIVRADDGRMGYVRGSHKVRACTATVLVT